MSNEHEKFAVAVSWKGLAAAIPLAIIDRLRINQRAEFDRQTILEFQDNPITNAFYYNSGDTVNGLSGAILIGMLLDAKLPHLPERLKATLSFVGGILVVSTAELASILNYGEVNDIPAGAVGSLMYLGIRHFARERFISRQISPP